MGNTTKWVTAVLFVAGGAFAPTLAIAGSCTNDVLTGVYGLQISGSLKAPASAGVATAPVVNAAAGYARLVMDGGGNLYGDSSASIAGNWSQGPVTGQYTVNDDCTFGMTLTDTSGATRHFDGVLTRSGDSAAVLQTDAGTGLTGGMKRSGAFCGGGSIPGNMKLQSSGAVADTGTFSSIGLLNIDDQGNVSAVETRFANGAASHSTSTGSLVVNSDCTVSLSLASGGGLPTAYQGILVNGGRELMLVRSGSGASVSAYVAGQ